MKTRILVDKVANRYKVQIEIYKLSALEEEKINELGQPLVDTGGQFTGSVRRPGDSEDTVVDFILPITHRRLPDDFPVREIFDLDDDEDSDIKAHVFATEINHRIQSIKNNLISQPSHFEGETIQTF